MTREQIKKKADQFDLETWTAYDGQLRGMDIVFPDDRKYRIACQSWHLDFPGIITSPAIDDYDNDWLPRIIGNDVAIPPYNKVLIKTLKRWLRNNEEEITEFLDDIDISKDSLVSSLRAAMSLA